MVTGNRWKPAKHLTILCDRLEAIARGALLRLMVFMPPRYGKSEAVSRGFPAWYLSNYPDNEVILASYGAELAEDMSRWAQQYFTQSAGLFDLAPDRRSRATDHWRIRGHRGGMVAAGIGGPITGRGGNVVLIDDPVKNVEEARSRIYQDHTYDWFQGVAKTRLAPHGAIVLVMTRWDRLDLAGRLLEDAKHGRGDKWEVLSFPGLALGEDSLGRKVGEALWPARYPLEELLELRRTMPAFMWSALIQQNPTLDARTVLWTQDVLDKWRLPQAPPLPLIGIGVDIAAKSKRRSNETGIVAAGRDVRGHGHVLADRSGIYTPHDWATTVIALFKEVNATIVVVEDNQGGEMIAETIWGIDPSIPIVEIPSTLSKFGSAVPLSSLTTQGQIHHVGFFSELELQMCSLTPKDVGQEDDRLDAARIILTYLLLGQGEEPRVVMYEDRHEISSY